MVLWRFLARALNAESGRRLKVVVDNDAERWAPNDVLTGLESALAQPFQLDSEDFLQRAAAGLIMARGDWPG